MFKRLITLIPATLLCVAAVADPVTPEEALEIAKTFAVSTDTPTLVKAATRTAAKAKSLSATVAATSPYYIYSRGEGQGYVIVSGDDCLPSVLGYAESGDYDEDNLPCAFYAFLNYYQGLIEDAQAAGENVSRASAKRAKQKASSKSTVSVLMTTAWHQSSPYNSWCPYITDTSTRAATGCVATAGAQVVYYWHKDNPNYYGYTTPTYSYGDAPVTESVAKGTPIKWDLMLDNYNSSYPEEYGDAVGEFVFALGASTWLTYGSSTSGQISNLVSTFSGQFNLSGTCVYKGSTSDDSWATTVYNDLCKGHPIVYCGYNDTSGGHAVVIDGYNASSELFHFNFGWGGTSDGYYTVDDETGMNGFNSEQGMTYLVEPMTKNLSATITQPDGYYVSHSNNIQITVQNNGTLDYSGIYLFAESSSSSPTTLSDAKDSDTETTISADGEDVVINLSVKPSTARTFYLTVTDEDLNVLDQITVTATEYVNDLTFEGFTIYSSSDTQTINGEEYAVVYGERTTIVANVTNNSDESYEDSPRLDIYSSDDDGATFTLLGTKYANSTDIGAGETGEFSFTISSTTAVPITTGVPYYAALRNPLTTKGSTAVTYTTTDTVARFILQENEDFACELDGTTLRFTGQWNAYQFSTYAGRSANSGATTYDLTGVTSLGPVPAVEDKPNALYYVSDDSGVTGTNIVTATSNTATELDLTTGYDFAPWADIQADKVTFTMDINPNEWALVTAPCAFDLPNGVYAKEITSHSSSGINGKADEVRAFEAGKTYLTMISDSRNATIEAENVTVVSAPVTNTDTAVVGTYVATTAPAGAFIIELDDEGACYFVPQDDDFTVEGLLGYFYASNVTKQFRANSNLSLDPRYIVLGQAIATAYATLDEYADIVSEEAYQWLSDSIAAAEEVWSNRTITSSSSVTAYAEALLELLETYITSYKSDLDDETDMTGLIINPSFELNSSGASTGSLYGWTNGGSASVKSATNNYYRGVGADGSYLAYSFSSSDSTGTSLSQVVKDGLVAGLYQLSALVGTAEGHTVTLFANSDSATVDAHEFGQYYLTEVSIDSIVILDGDSLNLGIADGWWYKADNFQLTYVRGLTAEEDPVAISSVNADQTGSVVVRPTTGGLSLTAMDGQEVRVYSVTGALVYRSRLEGTQTITLPQGVYIVDGNKVLVR